MSAPDVRVPASDMPPTPSTTGPTGDTRTPGRSRPLHAGEYTYTDIAAMMGDLTAVLGEPASRTVTVTVRADGSYVRVPAQMITALLDACDRSFPLARAWTASQYHKTHRDGLPGDELCFRVASGQSVAQIATAYGCSRQKVCTALTRHAIPIPAGDAAHDLAEHLSTVLGLPVSQMLHASWYTDGPSLELRADCLRTLIDAHPLWAAVSRVKHHRGDHDAALPSPMTAAGLDPALFDPDRDGVRAGMITGEARARLANALRTHYEARGDVTVEHLAKVVACPPSLIRDLLVESGTTIRDSAPASQPAPDDLAGLGVALRHFYLTGLAHTSLARLADQPVEQVWRALRAVGLIKVGEPRVIRTRRAIAEEELLALGGLIGPRYASGTSLRTLATLSDRTNTSIFRNALVAAGYSLRLPKDS